MAVENSHERGYVRALRVKAGSSRLWIARSNFGRGSLTSLNAASRRLAAIFLQICDFAGLRDRKSKVKVRQCGK
jgi:hypothetical protein